ncbi:MAG: cation:proton antiporter [Acidimicrobiales bacterium]
MAIPGGPDRVSPPLLLAATKLDLPGLVCIDVAIIIVVARLMGALFRRLHQPTVLGEIIGGILLGPSALGLLPGHLTGRLFPTAALPTLSALAQLGVVVFVFIVGLEVDLGLLRGRRRVAATVSVSSVVLPFGLGFAAAFLLHEHFGHVGTHEVKLLPFALFIGATMSVTAFPVLARVLSERGMLGTELGSFALACAAMDDVFAWTILAVVIGIIQSSGALSLPRIIGELVAFVAVVLLGVRPVLRRFFDRDRKRGALSLNTLAAIIVGTLVSAWITDKIGINLIFGAFLFGAAVPKRGSEGLVAEVVERLESAILLLLLPIFFVVAGLSVNLRSLGTSDLPYLALILAVAVGGKFFGAAVAARLQGVTRRRAMALGTLMNTRGLTELVVLTIGLTIGVLDTRLYSLMVTMAVVTTLMTSPMLRRVYPDRMLAADIAEAQQRLASSGGYSVLVVLNESDDPVPLMATGARLAGGGGQVLLARLLSRVEAPEHHADLSGALMRLAAAVEGLNDLAGRYPEASVSPIAQLSSDVEADVSALIGRTGVNAVVTGPAMVGRRDAASRLCGEAACDVVTVLPWPQGGGGVTALVDGPEEGAALEIAARIWASGPGGAATATAPLCLVPATPSGRGRARRLAERLQTLGIANAVSDETATVASLLVRGWPDDGRIPLVAGPCALVYSSEDPERVGIDQRLVRLDRAHRLRQPAGDGAGGSSPTPVGAEE